MLHSKYLIYITQQKHFNNRDILNVVNEEFNQDKYRTKEN